MSTQIRTTTVSTFEILQAAETVGIAGGSITLNLSRISVGPLDVATDARFLPSEKEACFGVLMSPGETFRFLTEMDRRVPGLGNDLSDMMLTTWTRFGELVWFPKAVHG